MEHRIKHKSGTLTECNVDCRWTNRGIAIEDRKGFFGGGLSGKLLRWPWASLPVATTWYLKIIQVEKNSVSLNHTSYSNIAFKHRIQTLRSMHTVLWACVFIRVDLKVTQRTPPTWITTTLRTSCRPIRSWKMFERRKKSEKSSISDTWYRTWGKSVTSWYRCTKELTNIAAPKN